MDLEGIRLLIKVVELGSVQRAAQVIGISRSSLRRKLDNLKAEVGSELLVHGAAGVTLTPAGAIVVEDGRELIERFGRMVSSAKSMAGDITGRVLVVVPVGMPDVPRVALLRALGAVAPAVCLEEIERAEPLNHVHEPFDLMFHFGDAPVRGRWFSRTLIRARLVPLASEAYLEEMGRPTTLDDLANHRLLNWRFANLSPNHWPLWSGASLPIRPVCSSRNAQMLHRAAQEGAGILLGNPDPLLLPGPTPLVPVLEQEIGRELAFRCLSPIPSDADPRTRAVLEGIQSVLAQLGPPSG